MILENLVKNSGLLVSCKIRLLDTLTDTIDFINKVQSSGIDFLTIHLRKREENAKTKANWGRLKDIKKIMKIPLIANGDIFTPKDIQTLKQCKCKS